MNPNYVQRACHCTPLRMCSFCAKWLRPARPKVRHKRTKGGKAA